jgi:O-antigen ligase
VIHWQPGYVYPPVFYPPHYPLDAPHAVFFALIAIAVGALTFRRPALGVGVLVFCAPFADAQYAFGTSFTVPKAALVGFVLALLVHRSSLRVLAERPVRGFLFAFAGILASIALSVLYALHHDAVAREFAKWLEYAITFGAVAVGFAADPDDRPIWTALISVAFVQVAESVFQLLFGASAGVFVQGRPVPRVSGSLEGPNQFAGWLNVLVPVLFARTLAHRNPWLVTALVLSAAAEAATLSRSGIVAGLAAAAVVVVVSRPTRTVGLRFGASAVALVAILVALGLSAGLEARFFSLAEVAQADHLGTRQILWASAVELWRMSPIVGIGAGNFEFDLGMVGHPEVQTHANSVYLQALSETGLMGLAAMLFLIWTTIATFARRFSRRPLVIGMFASGVALALHQVYDDLWFFPKVGVFWAVMLAIAVVEVLASRDDVGPLPGAV